MSQAGQETKMEATTPTTPVPPEGEEVKPSYLQAFFQHIGYEWPKVGVVRHSRAYREPRLDQSDRSYPEAFICNARFSITEKQSLWAFRIRFIKAVLCFNLIEPFTHILRSKEPVPRSVWIKTGIVAIQIVFAVFCDDREYLISCSSRLRENPRPLRQWSWVAATLTAVLVSVLLGPPLLEDLAKIIHTIFYLKRDDEVLLDGLLFDCLLSVHSITMCDSLIRSLIMWIGLLAEAGYKATLVFHS